MASTAADILKQVQAVAPIIEEALDLSERTKAIISAATAAGLAVDAFIAGLQKTVKGAADGQAPDFSALQKQLADVQAQVAQILE